MFWKASEKSPLCAIACQNIWNKVAKKNNLPEGVSCIINGNYKVGEMMTSDNRLPLISATDLQEWEELLVVRLLTGLENHY